MVFRIAVSGYAGFYKELVGYVTGALSASDVTANIASDERNKFSNEEDFLVGGINIPFYGIRQLESLYDGSICNNVWEILIIVNPSLFSKYEEIIPRRVFKYFEECMANAKLLGFICDDAYGELWRDYMSDKRKITKFGKTMVIPHVNIDGKELRESALIEILEAVFDGPVNNYDICEDTADALVELGYLEAATGERQAGLYRIKNLKACEELYNFLFTDSDETIT